MPLLCSSVCCSSKDISVNDKTPETTDDGLYHNFQIGTLLGEKWKSKAYNVHDNVTLTTADVGVPDYWRVEREETEALWSFHVLSSKGEKLYLSYDDQNNDITLELKVDGGKKWLFELLTQLEGGHLIRTQNNNNRYVGKNGDKLEIIVTNDPPENLQWLIKESFVVEDSPRLLRQRSVEVCHMNKKWITKEPTSDQPIPVRPAGRTTENFEIWNMITESSKIVLFSPYNNSEVYAACTKTLTNDVLLEERKKDDLRLAEYTPMRCQDGYKLKKNPQWIGVSDDSEDAILTRVDDEKDAVIWKYNTVSVKYKDGDKYVSFPPIDHDVQPQ